MEFTQENAIIGGNTQTFDFKKPEMFCWITEDAIISGYTWVIGTPNIYSWLIV